MSTLRRSAGGNYSLAFRFPPGKSAQQFTRSLKTSSLEEAEELQSTVDRTIRFILEGVLQLPENPNSDQVWQFLRSGGRLAELPSLAKRERLGEVVADYLDAKAIGPDEDSTLKTELRHTNNFNRLMRKGSWFDLIGPSDLRDYIAQRSKEKGIRKGKVKGDTIRKEIQTFRQLWDFAASKQIVSGQNPVGQIKLPKKRKKPPFKTWEQIEVILERGGLDEEQTAELWDCLFLREAEIGKFLAHVKSQAQFRRYPFIYPALAFCAYTGARRSEMFRCQIGDVEAEVMLREKKGDKESEFTYRHVPLHQGLKAILDEHLKNHPGGQFMFVKDNGEPLEDRTSRDAFKAVTQKSKWSVLRGYHILRHSFASNLARHGVPDHRIKEYVGHHTDEMARRYRHLFPEDKRADIEKLRF